MSERPRLSTRQNARLRARLEHLYKSQGLSERGLADRSGLSIGAVRNFGRTSTGPTLSTILAIAHGLGLHSVDQLLGPSAAMLFAQNDRLEQAIGAEAFGVVLDVNSGLTPIVDTDYPSVPKPSS